MSWSLNAEAAPIVTTAANVPDAFATAAQNLQELFPGGDVPAVPVAPAAPDAADAATQQLVSWPSVKARKNLARIFTIALSLLFHRAFFVDVGLLFARRPEVLAGEDINLRNSATYILNALVHAWNDRAAAGLESGYVEQDGRHNVFTQPFVINLVRACPSLTTGLSIMIDSSYATSSLASA
ncbi:hypothetical protein BV25DRAFT_1922934 [Artomyces pyxidatus]|uniref:Uncharacterized protein n=1 Tax=Artomyces pyxidatus TaxID=48021 RepID=A0ACB8SCJ8_9AGAM|nr:hypothetical protein BV25DRAFT_1922934 [Artomyces pyxidatus]